MSKQNSSVCKWKANERCVTVLHPLQCISIPHRGHPEDTRNKKKNKKQPRSAIPFCGLVTVATGSYQLDRKWHALTSIIQHLSFSSPPLCYLFNGRQHMGQTAPVRLQQNTATCLTRGTTKASRVGDWQPSPGLSREAPAALDTFGRPTATLVQQQKVSLVKLFKLSWAFQTEQGSSFTSGYRGVCAFAETLPVECLPLHLHTAWSGISVWSGLYSQQL